MTLPKDNQTLQTIHTSSTLQEKQAQGAALFAGFTQEDFDVFTIPGLEPRMEALIGLVRPKLNLLGERLSPALSVLCGEEMFLMSPSMPDGQSIRRLTHGLPLPIINAAIRRIPISRSDCSNRICSFSLRSFMNVRTS